MYCKEHTRKLDVVYLVNDEGAVGQKLIRVGNDRHKI